MMRNELGDKIYGFGSEIQIIFDAKRHEQRNIMKVACHKRTDLTEITQSPMKSALNCPDIQLDKRLILEVINFYFQEK
jgi:hypothetical protein